MFHVLRKVGAKKKVTRVYLFVYTYSSGQLSVIGRGSGTGANPIHVGPSLTWTLSPRPPLLSVPLTPRASPVPFGAKPLCLFKAPQRFLPTRPNSETQQTDCNNLGLGLASSVIPGASLTHVRS